MIKLLKAIFINIVIIALGVSIVYFFSPNSQTFKDKHAQHLPAIGQPAPKFMGISHTGKKISLSDYTGKTVVLEWKNHLCPFVKKHYSQNNMQHLQKELTDKGGVWLSIISSALGKQGHLTMQECENQIQKENSHATAVILDISGAIGKLYKAKTTPHMFVINPAGILVYKGAIDSIRSANKADIAEATNYVNLAITAIKNETPMSPASSTSYGCSIKY